MNRPIPIIASGLALLLAAVLLALPEPPSVLTAVGDEPSIGGEALDAPTHDWLFKRG